MKINSYKELIVWQKSMNLARLVYEATKSFPKSETYGLISQLRRSTVSIPSNIAEGYARKSRKEYLQFYSIAYGSVLELETQVMLSKDFKYIETRHFDEIMSLIGEVSKMLHSLILKLNAKPS
jgi:four helix bundle protein